jgi:hypothetical protein
MQGRWFAHKVEDADIPSQPAEQNPAGGAFGEVLAQQAVGVLIRAALPGAVRSQK